MDYGVTYIVGRSNKGSSIVAQFLTPPPPIVTHFSTKAFVLSSQNRDVIYGRPLKSSRPFVTNVFTFSLLNGPLFDTVALTMEGKIYHCEKERMDMFEMYFTSKKELSLVIDSTTRRHSSLNGLRRHRQPQASPNRKRLMTKFRSFQQIKTQKNLSGTLIYKCYCLYLNFCAEKLVSAVHQLHLFMSILVIFNYDLFKTT